MKNLKKILVVLVVALMPLIVKADMGAPEITAYEVRVKSLNGAVARSLNSETITIPYDTVLKVVFESQQNGIAYGDVSYKGQDYSIKLSDVEVLNKTVDLSTWQKHEKKEMYVFRKGAYLYNGPSFTYGKVDGEIEIPVGETVTFEYSDELFAYVTYKGVSGWVFIYGYPFYDNIASSLAYVAKSGSTQFIISDVKLEEEPVNSIISDKKYTDTIIPAYTEIEYKYYYFATPKEINIFVNYKGEEGWISIANYNGASKTNKESKILTIKDTKLYENAFKDKVIKTIPKNTELKVFYETSDYNDSYYYVEYDGVKGWVYYTDYNDDGKTSIAISTNTYKKNYDRYKTNASVDVYNNINGEKVSTLNADKEFYVEMTYPESESITWYYIKNLGWVKKGANDTTNSFTNMGDESIPLDDNDYYYEKNRPSEELNKENTDNGEDSQEKLLPIKYIALYSILGAIIISLVAFVTIKLINKKKNNNNNLSK